MRKGFTLLEVVVSLAVAGMTVLLAHRLLSSIASTTDALLRKRADLDTHANRQRWVEEAFLSLAVGQPGDPPFEGRPSSLDAAAWSTVAQGWRERVPLSFRLAEDRLEVEIGATRFPLAERVTGVLLEYLAPPEEGENVWVPGWSSELGAPEAVRIILRYGEYAPDDTSVYVVGERG